MHSTPMTPPPDPVAALAEALDTPALFEDELSDVEALDMATALHDGLTDAGWSLSHDSEREAPCQHEWIKATTRLVKDADGNWLSEPVEVPRWQCQSCGLFQPEARNEAPCPHRCEEGHFTGDDMVMAEIGTGWPAKWEAMSAALDEILELLVYTSVSTVVVDRAHDIAAKARAAIEGRP